MEVQWPLAELNSYRVAHKVRWGAALSQSVCVTLHYSIWADYSGESYLTSQSTPGHAHSDFTTQFILRDNFCTLSIREWDLEHLKLIILNVHLQ